MQSMKKVTFLPLLFLAVFALGTMSFRAERKVIAVVFNKEMTKQDLVSLQQNLREKNIILVFNKMTFTKNRLTYIDFSIDFGDGFSGTSKSAITRKTEVGFIRDYNDDAEQPFVVGNLKQK